MNFKRILEKKIVDEFLELLVNFCDLELLASILQLFPPRRPISVAPFPLFLAHPQQKNGSKSHEVSIKPQSD